ncbi:hypothetical protein [Candidatus Nitrotoga sp. 1052]|uniref:hypothetical protein n=1 Tax=Candidatus Nitrotoga sp. 1052 TaxID=2886964 RepID=UPI001EF481D2|nr:hypothetical protein [Candidatus Nitrotoga sp. 1052]CAH1073227.1 hypothetical protein NTG1052_20020 [Candidatus Nitrotoga sp. 1052]
MNSATSSFGCEYALHLLQQGLPVLGADGADQFSSQRLRLAQAAAEPELLDEDAGDTIAVEVGTLKNRTFHPDGQIFQTGGIPSCTVDLHDGLCVFVLDRRKAAFIVAAGVMSIAGSGKPECMDQVGQIFRANPAGVVLQELLKGIRTRFWFWARGFSE